MELPPKALELHRKETQLPTKCNRIYTAADNINVLMRPSEALQVAANMLKKVQLLMDHGLADEWAVKLWSTGGDKIKFGLEPAVNKPRKPKRASSL